MKTHGEIIITGPDIGRQMIGTTCCVHCGSHFIPGKHVGFCHKCNGHYCGPQCQECIPMEQMIENIERGLPLNYKPVRV